MNAEERIEAFSTLGVRLSQLSEEERQTWGWQAKANNNWFSLENVQLAINGIIHYLQKDKLTHWLSAYNLTPVEKKVGVVMAGNIPAVGFHDFMCVLLSGHTLLAKLSSQDAVLLKKIASLLVNIDQRFAEKIHFVERLNEAEAIIATGSDNSARYFKYYFSKVPHIIRQNRSSSAILTGKETPQDLATLGNDIFQHFGLGCRSVSKLFVPEAYSFQLFFESIESCKDVLNHNKYINNYDYNKSILLVNKVPHQDNGFLLVTENESMVSPVSVVYFESYKNDEDLQAKIAQQRNKIQCIVAKDAWFPKSVSFGKAQQPDVCDYADNVDTMQFLTSL
jgi:hypothetical protein